MREKVSLLHNLKQKKTICFNVRRSVLMWISSSGLSICIIISHKEAVGAYCAPTRVFSVCQHGICKCLDDAFCVIDHLRSMFSLLSFVLFCFCFLLDVWESITLKTSVVGARA